MTIRGTAPRCAPARCTARLPAAAPRCCGRTPPASVRALRAPARRRPRDGMGLEQSSVASTHSLRRPSVRQPSVRSRRTTSYRPGGSSICRRTAGEAQQAMDHGIARPPRHRSLPVTIRTPLSTKTSSCSLATPGKATQIESSCSVSRTSTGGSQVGCRRFAALRDEELPVQALRTIQQRRLRPTSRRGGHVIALLALRVEEASSTANRRSCRTGSVRGAFWMSSYVVNVW